MKKLAFVTFELNEEERIEEVAKRFGEYLDGRNVGYAIIQGAHKMALPSQVEEPWKTKLKKILRDLGVSTHLNGYYMLLYVMEYIALYRPKRVKLREIYLYIQETRNLEYKFIEESIRHLVQKVRKINSCKEMNSSLGTDIGNVKLTPITFIVLLSETIFEN